MKNLLIIFISSLLFSCSISAEKIKAAQILCKDNKGVAYISLTFRAYYIECGCNNGATFYINLKAVKNG